MFTFAYLQPIIGSILLQLLIFYGFSFKFSKDFSVGVLMVAYIMATILYISSDDSGLNIYMGFVMFMLLPSYVVVSVLKSIGSSIDNVVEK